jgi:hypothetical protein
MMAMPHRRVDLGQQGRQNMAQEQVEIVGGTVQLGRDRRYEIAAVLATVGLGTI